MLGDDVGAESQRMRCFGRIFRALGVEWEQEMIIYM